jgi:hypothetical protein
MFFYVAATGFGIKTIHNTANCKKYVEDCHNHLYISASSSMHNGTPHIKTKIKTRCVGNVAGMEEKCINTPESNAPLRKHRRRWKDNITVDLKENVYQSVSWTELANNTRHSWAILKTLIKFGVL